MAVAEIVEIAAKITDTAAGRHPHKPIFSPEELEKVQPPIILYVEDNYQLKRVVMDVLELAGWEVEHCRDGAIAIAMMRHRKHYALLLIDNEVPGVDGLKIIKEARSMAHLEKTPIILLSIKDRAEEARRAGADEFLQKPHNIVGVVDTIRRLLAPAAAPGK